MKEEIIKYLSECNLVELNHLISSTLNQRQDCSSEMIDGEYAHQSKIALCEITREKFEDETWPDWEFFLIASEDKEQYDESWTVGNGKPCKESCLSNLWWQNCPHIISRCTLTNTVTRVFVCRWCSIFTQKRSPQYVPVSLAARR